MIRSAAAVLAAAACLFAGMRASSTLSSRVRVLEELLTMLVELRTRMEFGRECLCELIRLLSLRDSLSHLTFLGECAAECNGGTPFPQAWADSVEAFAASCPLARDDIKLLRSLGDFAGITDISGQLEFFRLSEKLLDERISSAREIQKKYGRICTAMGASAGIAAGIIIC